MTTTAQVKALVQPLLARNADLVLIGRRLFLKPLRHFARFVMIDRTRSPDRFVPLHSIRLLFEPIDRLGLMWSGDLAKGTLWSVQHCSTQADFTEMIERKALPLLRAVDSLEQIPDYVKSLPYGGTLRHFPVSNALFHAANGDFAGALFICEKTRANKYLQANWPKEYVLVAEDLPPFLRANDREGVARLLHAAEAATVRTLKLEKIWERSPFPLELH